MATNLLNFDQVVALTEQTINTQFDLMFLTGVIDKDISLKLAPNSDFGIFGTIKAPTVSIALHNTVNPTQVSFAIPFDTGTAKYSSPLGQTEELNISGWTIALDVNLKNLTLTSDYNGVKVSSVTKTAVDRYLNQSIYTVTAILLDFDNLNYGTAEVFDQSGKPSQNSTILTMLNLLIKHMIKDGNPYLLSINPTLSKGSESGLDAFKPTGVMYNTHLYDNVNAVSPFNTYNMLVMNQGRKLPWTETTLPKFSQNLASDDPEVQGRFYISRDQFNSAYIEALVLPTLAKAMGGATKFTGGAGSWSYSHEKNTSGTDLQTGYNDFSVEQHTCSLKVDTDASTSDQVVLSGGGSFYKQTKAYNTDLKLIHWLTATAEQKFSYTVTLEAGAEGEITISFSSKKGELTKSHWESTWLKITKPIEAAFFDSMTKEVADRYSTWEAADFSSFTKNAEPAFKALQDSIILPAASVYFFKNMALTAEQDVQFDITIKN
ncbi:MAG: hypothetical protein R3F37_11645 [Candidatus Competibacteraceae bacterium]